jgi:hypothetical protein
MGVVQGGAGIAQVRIRPQVDDRQIVLRAGVALIGGFLVPVHRLFHVLRQAAPAFLIHQAEIILRRFIVFIGCLAKPTHALRIVFRQSPAAIQA